VSADTFCCYCGANTNPTYSAHREEACPTKPRIEPPASGNENCGHCNQPRFICGCTPEELAQATQSVSDEPPLGEPRPVPDVFHLQNNLALADHLDQNLDGDGGDPTVTNDQRQHFIEAFTRRLQTPGEYILENFIADCGLSIAQAKPLILAILRGDTTQEPPQLEPEADLNPLPLHHESVSKTEVLDDVRTEPQTAAAC